MQVGETGVREQQQPSSHHRPAAEEGRLEANALLVGEGHYVHSAPVQQRRRDFRRDGDISLRRQAAREGGRPV